MQQDDWPRVYRMTRIGWNDSEMNKNPYHTDRALGRVAAALLAADAPTNPQEARRRIDGALGAYHPQSRTIDAVIAKHFARD